MRKRTNSDASAVRTQHDPSDSSSSSQNIEAMRTNRGSRIMHQTVHSSSSSSVDSDNEANVKSNDNDDDDAREQNTFVPRSERSDLFEPLLSFFSSDGMHNELEMFLDHNKQRAPLSSSSDTDNDNENTENAANDADNATDNANDAIENRNTERAVTTALDEENKRLTDLVQVIVENFNDEDIVSFLNDRVNCKHNANEWPI